MYSSTSFVVQIAHLCIEICGYNDEDSVCLQDLKRVFGHHKVSGDTTAVHRIVVCASNQFEITSEATLRWVSPCLGVAGYKHNRHWPFFSRIFASNKEILQYSGTCDVLCYEDMSKQGDYLVAENGEWRIKHNAKEHITYVYSDGHNEMSDGLPSILMHVIGSQYGYYLLFASCVAIGEEALLFIGEGGVGKTSLCMELMKKGATYVGDDLVLVYLTREKAMVGSLLFPVKCYIDKKCDHKKKIDVVSQLPQRPPLNVPLKSIYLLQRGGTNSEPYLKPIQGDALFENMLKLTNKANTNADAHHFVDTIYHICCSVPSSYLVYGDCNILNLSFFEQ